MLLIQLEIEKLKSIVFIPLPHTIIITITITINHSLRKIILPTNWLRFFVYSTNLVCKMNNCIIPLTI